MYCLILLVGVKKLTPKGPCVRLLSVQTDIRKDRDMIEDKEFRKWLVVHKNYSDKVVSDTISRVKRADRILEWHNDEIYQFELERNEEYKGLSTCVRSQIKGAVKMYFEYAESKGRSNG